MADTDNKYYYKALDKDEAHIMQNIIFSKRNSRLNIGFVEQAQQLLVAMAIGCGGLNRQHQTIVIYYCMLLIIKYRFAAFLTQRSSC
ncbi:hypothetical protein [Nitrosomonas sp. JL21]|uniref:hypothetical protein n=1 Tax=Nitrosomonas sp. JL21 TaxID=153949 RepID=UPI00136A7D0C|nr:hypothetical protein [Nitrosomonas sp. JL21]